MTKKLLIMAITGLSSTMVFAADLYVRNGGAGGAYPTITEAIVAASNGDRIIIQPKVNGDPYVENLIINKSLTLVSETNYSKYIVQGNVTINPAAGRMVTISNLSTWFSGSYSVEASGATTGGRTTINLLNCNLGYVFTNTANITTNISGCIATGSIIFSHGRATGNKAQFMSVHSLVPDTSMAASNVEVYGNIVSDVLSYTQTSYNFKFYNNFCARVAIQAIKTDSFNEIINNTVYNPAPSDVAPFYISSNNNGNAGTVLIMNNAASFAVGQTNVCIQNQSNNANVIATYNVFTNSFITQGNVTQSNNSGTVNMNFNNTTYTLTGMNENAGDPDVKYTDLDLTRNDAGHYGGSNSWANYWPANVGNRPQVNYLVTPRTISSGTLTISGSGFSK
ncbi:hypothetical protein [Chryseobacterium sp.]|uniref:hypothetical protein n=1 Tax=Chryseobacterium sp. TaxID=1871047 RepID=UPI00321925B9